MLLMLADSLILWNMRVWHLSLVAYWSCNAGMTATYPIWRRTLLL